MSIQQKTSIHTLNEPFSLTSLTSGVLLLSYVSEAENVNEEEVMHEI
jgi:hypothetical protein